MQESTIQYFKLNKPSLTSKNFHRFHDNGKGIYIAKFPKRFRIDGVFRSFCNTTGTPIS